MFAFLLDQVPEIREHQLQTVEKNEGRASVEETIRLELLVNELNPRFRLPVFEILLGTLNGISLQQYQTFRATVNSLVEADQKVDLFEFFLRHHLLVHLDRRFGKGLRAQVKFKALSPLKDDICRFLAILVRVGHEQDAQAQAAFMAAINAIDQPWEDAVSMINEVSDYDLLAASLDRLSQASPIVKKRVLSAAAVAITHDQKVTVEEAELFRAMSESLDCPVPPVVATPDQGNIRAS